MEFNLKLLKETDYKLLCQWWKWWRWTAPPQDCLPNNGEGGIMIYKDKTPIVAGFLYTTNSNLAWLEFVISNPTYKDNDRQDAIDYLLESLCYLAEKQGFKAIFTSLKSESLIKNYQRIGFVKSNNKTTELVLRF